MTERFLNDTVLMHTYEFINFNIQLQTFYNGTEPNLVAMLQEMFCLKSTEKLYILSCL